MREFNVRAYEDHWLVSEEGGGELKVIASADALVKELSWQPIGTPPVEKPRVVRKRTRRTRAQIAAAKEPEAATA